MGAVLKRDTEHNDIIMQNMTLHFTVFTLKTEGWHIQQFKTFPKRAFKTSVDPGPQVISVIKAVMFSAALDRERECLRIKKG